ncbi:MAG TPA: tRNA (adenosine(37)-N6)-dimethylallyltransferase MiaA [Candidatus Dormibacteraeota bacterium]|nr:tRNA (adenosine(37)-N6)-dimethylallyltransferase MiaA [Candidatus Dormibacteraeota bacterium]
MSPPGVSEKPANPQVLAIMGPTASGKTELAVALARELGGELVNADSRQAIAELTIGVGKPTMGELQGIPCHGLDWSHLGQPFSAASYRALAAASIEELAGRGRTALVVGGSGLYIRALLGGFDFGGVAPESSRARTNDVSPRELEDPGQATRDLRRLDPQRAAAVDLRNPRRVVRAAELARAGARARQLPPPWRIRKLGCHVSRTELRARIESRSDRLVAEPLRREVERLQAVGVSTELLARSAIGYSEVVDWAAGRCDRHQAVERVAFRTWRYAKAQLTWLRSEPELQWVDAEASLDDLVRQCRGLIESELSLRWR